MFGRLILVLLGKKRESYKKWIKYKGLVYSVCIERYIPADEELERWEQALEKTRAC